MKVERVLIVKLKHLGDTLTTTPVLSGVTAAWPGAKVTYLINPGGEDLVRHHPDVADVLTVPRSGGPIPQLKLIRKLRAQKFDLALELSGGDRGAFLAWISGAGVRVGYRPGRPRPVDRRLLFTHTVTSRMVDMHMIDYHLETLRVLGVDPGRPLMSLHWPPEAEARVRELLESEGLNPGRDYVVVHPSSRWMFKTWRPEANAEIIDHIRTELDLPAVVTSSPAQNEMDYAADVIERCQTRPVDLTGRLNLSELAALIGRARFFFGVDSLPMHMAAATKTPAVALFGPSGEQHWAPWGPGHQVVAKDWDCRPCGRDGCAGGKISRCLVELTPNEVYPALHRAASKKGTGGNPF